MKHMYRLTAIMLVGFSLFLFKGYPASAGSEDKYQGVLNSGNTENGKLVSDELWMFHGKKDQHIVITTAVDEGEAPPQIYVYPPEGSQYEARSDAVDSRSQLLEYELKESGRYAVIVHPCAPGDGSSYRIAYSILDPGDLYTVHPDDPDYLLKVTTVDDRSDRIFVDRTHGFIPASIVFNLATFGVGPIIFTGFTALNQVAVGADLYSDRVAMESRHLDDPPAGCDKRVARG